MLKLFKKRWFMVTLGLLLLGLFVWYAGPYFAFADYHPLAPVWVRVGLIALVVAIYIGGAFLKKLKAISANTKLAQAVAKPVPQAGGADAEQLRERFAEAVSSLKQGKKGGHSLYELPWYVIIGAPGAGKTTALINSGLNFPLEQKFGKGAVRGVGGTRNCDWWFTDEAVLLDTAGRYTTQDSDQSADNAGWREFLALLMQYRKRRPLNGVIVALSATDLITQHQGERESHIAAVRRRLDEINKQLKVQLPVYVLVTKCDLIAGFTEYFDDLSQEGRGQVWGVTFPYQVTTSGQAAVAFPAEFNALVKRLNERVFPRIEAERDAKRRTALFAFPQQFAGVGETLRHYIDEVFAATRHEGIALLRGVYFTSGTQEGTPLDRILGALGRSLGPGVEAVSKPAGRGKSYFIESLLKDVLFAESGLAGVNKTLERRRVALQAACYLGVLGVVVVGLLAFTVSYKRNQSYVNEVSASVQQLQPALEATADASLQQILPRLDQTLELVKIADRYPDGAPLTMRWGLFQGGNLGNQARDAYLRELNSLLLPRVGEAIKQRLVGYTAEPDKLYEYLKTYLMLGLPEHIEKTQLRVLVDLELELAYSDQPDVRERLSAHFANLMQEQDSLRPLPVDNELIAQARNAIKQASVAKLMYSRLKLQHAGESDRSVRLDTELGLGAQSVLIRKSGKPLSEVIPAIYTPAVFAEISGLGQVELLKQFTDDQWVLGDELISMANAPRIIEEVMAVYEQDYIRAWDEMLNDVGVAAFRSATDLVNGLAVVAGPTSPLRAFYATVDKNTYLVKSPAEANAPGALDKAQQAIKDRLGKLLSAGAKAAGTGTDTRYGASVTAHFSAIHRLLDVASGQAPIDRVLAQIGQVQQKLQSVGTGVGEISPLEALTQSGSGESLKVLQQQAATLPPALAGLVTQVAGKSESMAIGQARNELVDLYNIQVVKECTALISGRYPFDARSAVDVPLADFGRIFGSGGVFDTFYKTNLQSLVDTSRSPWVWRAGTTTSLGIPNSILRQFEQAQRIRDTYFRPGGQVPELRFNLTATSLDAAASRVLLEIDGQNFEYRHGPERTLPAVWPGPSPGVAAIAFEERAGARPNQVFPGPWALFRLLDAAAMQRQSDVRYVATWQAGSHEASYVIEATSIRNPFGKSELRQFRCGP